MVQLGRLQNSTSFAKVSVNTDLTQDSEVQISLEMHVWDNCFSLKICCPEQEHGENTGNKVRTRVL